MCDRNNIGGYLVTMDISGGNTNRYFQLQPTGQTYVRGIFVEHPHDIFPEYSENVPYETPGYIP